MNPELEALLKRIEAAGGPVEVDPFDMCFYLKEPYGCAWDRVGHDDIIDTALLIHALKLDALTRGVRSRTAHEPGRHRVWLYDEPGDQVGAAGHESEATAWCLAWLAAFEQEEAA